VLPKILESNLSQPALEQNYLKNDNLAKLLKLLILLSSEDQLKSIFPKIANITYYEDQEYAFDFIKRYISKTLKSIAPHLNIVYVNCFEFFRVSINGSDDDVDHSTKIKDKLVELVGCIERQSKGLSRNTCLFLDFNIGSPNNLLAEITQVIQEEFESMKDLIFLCLKPVKKEEARDFIKSKGSGLQQMNILIEFNYEAFKKDIVDIKLMDYEIIDSNKNVMDLDERRSWITSLKRIKLI